MFWEVMSSLLAGPGVFPLARTCCVGVSGRFFSRPSGPDGSW